MELQEADRVIRCDFCRVHHVIIARPYPVLHIPPRTEGDIHYAPYWRFRGAAYSLQNRGVRHKLIDASKAAIELRGLPFSLGLRAQTQPLRFVQPSSSGAFLMPQQEGKPMFAAQNGPALAAGRAGAGQVRALVGDILSLIYAPLVLDNAGASDGLTGKRLRRLDPGEVRSLPQAADKDRIRFLPALCPGCGWDLKGEKDSLAHLCEGCGRIWIAESGELVPVETGVYGSGPGADLCLPVWELEAESSVLPVNSRAEIQRLTNTAGANAQKNDPFAFRVPAFKINPKLFLRLARQASFLPAQGAGPGPGPEDTLHPVSLPCSEAAEALPVLICHLARNTRKITSLFPDETLRVRKRRLLFLPFRKAGSEFVQQEAEFAVPAKALFFARSL